MKRTLFAVALLMSALASAAVKVTSLAHCGEFNEEQEMIFSEANKTHSIISCPDKGVTATLTLTEETPEHATFSATVTKKGEANFCECSVQAVYGEKTTLSCSHEGTDATLTIVATQLSVTE